MTKERITTNNPCKGETWAEKEVEVLNSEIGLKLDSGFVHNKEESLKDFIKNLIVSYFNKHKTLNEDGVVYCGKGKYRSLIDIFLVSKHYYPNTTLEEVRNTLLTFDIAGHVCWDINRRVYKIKPYNNWILCNIEEKDEFNINLINYDSKKVQTS